MPDNDNNKREISQAARLLNWLTDESRRNQVRSQIIRHELKKKHGVAWYPVNDPDATPSPDDDDDLPDGWEYQGGENDEA